LGKNAYIGLGSNLGDRAANLALALKMMAGLPCCRLNGRSGLYSTEPVGFTDQDWFLNAACCLDVSGSAGDLIKDLLDIEKKIGRVRDRRWGPRVIDLDILLFGDEKIAQNDLTIPHPLMHVRRFVLMPLNDLAPQKRHPVLGNTISELLASLPDEGQRVYKIEDNGWESLDFC
jgi:2-amino-4-hydroxy-6-hydroxymethyldihydropteridine diphosphokinase